MLTLLILLTLVIGVYVGYQRGITLQLVYTLGYWVSFLVAQHNYKALGKKIELLIPYPSPTIGTKFILFDSAWTFDMDRAFYAGFSFVLILLMGWLVTRFLGMLSYGLTFMPLLRKGNDWLGAIFGGLVSLIGLVIVLTLVAMIPIGFIQNMFEKSGLARILVSKTPVISAMLHELWINKIIL